MGGWPAEPHSADTYPAGERRRDRERETAFGNVFGRRHEDEEEYEGEGQIASFIDWPRPTSGRASAS